MLASFSTCMNCSVKICLVSTDKQFCWPEQTDLQVSMLFILGLFLTGLYCDLSSSSVRFVSSVNFFFKRPLPG